jgi:membrane-bound lytic murein transglycosylase D
MISSDDLLRHTLLLAMAALVAGACGGTPQVMPEPDPTAPEPGAGDIGEAAVFAGQEGIDEAVADQAALDALREFEFGTLAKGGKQVRGFVLPPDLDGTADELDSRPLRRHSRGGTASLGAPTFDIDVESFASHRRVQYYVDAFTGIWRDRFTIWLGRLERYEGMIRTRFRRFGLPEDLVYLGLIESGYSNTAVSRARAVGMWQFIVSTAREYDLRVDRWVDERRDPFKSTDAAARHLLDLKEQFGSWYLAAAAYNGGATRVTRGLARLQPEDSLSDETFFALSDRRYLRRETRDYVPKLIAAAIIAKDAPSIGFDSVTPLAPLVFDEVVVADQTGLDVLASLADTTTAAMVELNPHYYRGVTPPGEQAIVRVPRDRGTMVARKYTALPPSERVNFLVHTVRRGETLGEIAQRYRVSLSFVRAANPGVRPRSLRIGQRLSIPISMAARRGAVEPLPLPRLRYRRTVSTTRRRPPASGVYAVRRGDTLWVIARRYSVTVSDLQRWNGMARGETLLRVGDQLRVIP